MKQQKRSAQERIKAWALAQSKPFDTLACARGALAAIKTTRNRLCEFVRDGSLRRVKGGDTVCYAPSLSARCPEVDSWTPDLKMAESILGIIRKKPKARLRYIARQLGVSHETVSRYVTALAAEGYLTLHFFATATDKPGPVKLNNLYSYKRGYA